MHRLLKQMGREIVKKQSLEEPGKRQFLWDANEIFDVLEGNTVSFFFFFLHMHVFCFLGVLS